MECPIEDLVDLYIENFAYGNIPMSIGSTRLKYSQDGGTSVLPHISVNWIILNRTLYILK